MLSVKRLVSVLCFLICKPDEVTFGRKNVVFGPESSLRTLLNRSCCSVQLAACKSISARMTLSFHLAGFIVISDPATFSGSPRVQAVMTLARFAYIDRDSILMSLIQQSLIIREQILHAVTMQSISTSLTRLLGMSLLLIPYVTQLTRSFASGIRIPVVCGAMAGGTSAHLAVCSHTYTSTKCSRILNHDVCRPK